MEQKQIKKSDQVKTKPPSPLDLRTPSGRKLPY